MRLSFFKKGREINARVQGGLGLEPEPIKSFCARSQAQAQCDSHV